MTDDDAAPHLGPITQWASAAIAAPRPADQPDPQPLIAHLALNSTHFIRPRLIAGPEGEPWVQYEVAAPAGFPSPKTRQMIPLYAAMIAVVEAVGGTVTYERPGQLGSGPKGPGYGGGKDRFELHLHLGSISGTALPYFNGVPRGVQVRERHDTDKAYQWITPDHLKPSNSKPYRPELLGAVRRRNHATADTLHRLFGVFDRWYPDWSRP